MIPSRGQGLFAAEALRFLYFPRPVSLHCPPGFLFESNKRDISQGREWRGNIALDAAQREIYHLYPSSNMAIVQKMSWVRLVARKEASRIMLKRDFGKQMRLVDAMEIGFVSMNCIGRIHLLDSVLPILKLNVLKSNFF